MPYSGTGGDYYDKTKSWTFLLNKYGYGPDASGFARFASYPLSNIRSGSYYWYRGLLQYMKTNILQWSITTKYNASSAAYWINAWSTMIKLPDLGNQLMGVSIRCVFSNFIDGTVTGTDISNHFDSEPRNDHTYFGKGCDNNWSGNEPPYGGSSVSCSYDTVQTYDNETQSIGTYINFQAASAGSGGVVSDENANAPDSFCPLGWQMPYGGTGGDYYDKSRSVEYLFYRYGTEPSLEAQKMKSYPISMVNSGHFYNGRWLFRVKSAGVFWVSSVKSYVNSYRLWVATTSMVFSDNSSKITLNSVRCSLILAKLKSNHNQKLDERDKVFGIRETSLLLSREAKISSICVLCGPDATTWSASARSPVTTGATKRSAKTPNVGFLPLQWTYRRIYKGCQRTTLLE